MDFNETVDIICRRMMNKGIVTEKEVAIISESIELKIMLIILARTGIL